MAWLVEQPKILILLLPGLPDYFLILPADVIHPAEGAGGICGGWHMKAKKSSEFDMRPRISSWPKNDLDISVFGFIRGQKNDLKI